MTATAAATAEFVAAVPILAALDIAVGVAFYRRLGFSVRHEAGDYAVLRRDGIELHLWHCVERHIAEHTACRIEVRGVDALHAELAPLGIIHPNAPLADKHWWTREFAITDPSGNLVTFYQRRPAPGSC